MGDLFGKRNRKPKPPPPVPPPPPPPVLETFEVFVHDEIRPGVGLGGVSVTLAGGEPRLSNPDGTAHFDIPELVQADFVFARPGYEPRGASAVPGIDARLDVPMRRLASASDVLPRVRVEPNLRWLNAGGQRLDYREKGAFTLLGRLQAGQEGDVRDYVRWMKSERFNAARVFICNTIGGFPSGPDRPGFWPACDRLLEIFAAEGLYLRPTLIAALEPFGGHWLGHGVDIWSDPVRSRAEQFCVEFAARYRDSTTIGIAELFNEPINIGLRRSIREIPGLGRKVKAVAPEMLLCGGADEESLLCVHPFDLVAIHFPRFMDVFGMNWIKRSSEFAPVQRHSQPVAMAVLSGEPANMGQDAKEGRDDIVRHPSAAFAYGAMSRAHMYLANFHSDDALYTEQPEDITLRCMRAFHDALDAFPMLTGNPWTGHHGHGAGDFWRDVWPPEDGIAERWVREGRGPWRAYGNGEFGFCFPEPKGWNWQSAAEASMERVKDCTDGPVDVAIYRRV